MNDNYNLESILEEIRRKKQAAAQAEKQQALEAETDEQVQPEVQEEETVQPEQDFDSQEEVIAQEETLSEQEETDDKQTELDDESIADEAESQNSDEEKAPESQSVSEEAENKAENADNTASDEKKQFISKGFNFEFDEEEEDTSAQEQPYYAEAEDSGDESEQYTIRDREDIDFDVDDAIKHMGGNESDDKDEDKTENAVSAAENIAENATLADEEVQEKAVSQNKPQPKKKEKKKEKVEKEEKPEPLLNEYRTPEDAPAILEELHQLKSSFILRLVLTIIIFAATLYLAAATVLPLPMPSAISLWKMPVMYIGANVVLTAAAVLINNSAIINGVSALIKLKPNNDSLMSFAALAAVLHGAAIAVSPSEWQNTPAVNLYFPLAVLGILFNLVGKMMFADRVSANFKIVSASYQKYTAHKVTENTSVFTDEPESEKHDITYFTESDFLNDFLKTAYDESYIEKPCRMLAPVIVIGSVLVGIIAFLVTMDIFAGVSAFAALACIGSPLTSTLVGNIPMGRAARTLYERGTCINGYEAIESFAGTDTVLLRADDIFPHGTVQMHGMKTFNNELIEDAVKDAASVVCAADCPLKHIFIPVLSKYSDGEVYDVDAYEVIDEEGIIADIRGREVVIGNRDMMNRYSVFLPSQDQEKKLRQDDREVLYVATEGRLSAVFIVSYHADIEVKDLLYSVQEKGIKVLVQSTDPFITSKRISELFDENSQSIKLMDKKSTNEFKKLDVKRESSPCLIASTTSRMMLLRAILSADRIRSAISISSILQILSVLMGAAIIAFFAITDSVIYLGCVPVMSYQIAWSVVIAVVNSLKKY